MKPKEKKIKKNISLSHHRARWWNIHKNWFRCDQLIKIEFIGMILFSNSFSSCLFSVDVSAICSKICWTKVNKNRINNNAEHTTTKMPNIQKRKSKKKENREKEQKQPSFSMIDLFSVLPLPIWLNLISCTPSSILLEKHWRIRWRIKRKKIHFTKTNCK